MSNRFVEELRGPIAATVDWWRDAAAVPKFRSGDALSSILGTVVHKKAKPVDDQQLAVFRDDLERRMHRHAREVMAPGKYKTEPVALDDVDICLRVDYGPEWILGQAASAAGLGMLPWKTSTETNRYIVSVLAGYGAGGKVVWLSPLVPPEDEGDDLVLRYVEVAQTVEGKRRHKEKIPESMSCAILAAETAILSDVPDEAVFVAAVGRGLICAGRPRRFWSELEPPLYRFEMTKLGRAAFDARTRDALNKVLYPEEC